MQIQRWILMDNNGFPIRETTDPYLYILSNGVVINIRGKYPLGVMGVPISIIDISIIDLEGGYSTIDKYLQYLNQEIIRVNRENMLNELGI